MSRDGSQADEEPLLVEPGLLRAFHAGERDAMSRVFRHYAPHLARRLKRGITVRVEGAPLHIAGLHSPFDIEAIVQETFVRVFESNARSRYDGLRPFLPYLTAVARNLLIDDARRRKRRQTISVADVETIISQESHEEVTDPHRTLEEADWRAALQAVVASFPEREHRVYVTRFIEGRTLDEAEQILPFSRSTIRRTEVQIRVLLVDGMAARGFFKSRPE